MTTDSPEMDAASEAGITPRNQFPFLLLLTTIAVFPIAFGFGKARVKMAAAKPHVRVETSHQDDRSEKEALPQQSKPVDRQHGDTLLKDGRFEAALHYYQSLGSTDHLRLPPELQFRIAVCQEGLGLWEEALVLDEKIAEASDSEPLASAAMFAQTRIHLRRNQPDRALSLLNLIAQRPHAAKRIRCEVAFLVPLAKTSQLIGEAESKAHHAPDERNDLTPTNDVLDWPLRFALDDIPVHDATFHAATSDAEDSHSDTAVANNDHSVAAVDDPANLTREHSDVPGMLNAAISASPNHRLVPHARFALGRLAQANGDHKLAVSHFVPLVGRTATPLAIRAAFNAAVSYYRLNNLPRACEMLVQVVHGAPGHEVHARSLILYGRLLLDRGEFREASFQLQRASGTRMSPQTQALASVYLGMAHLMRDNPRDAVESLFADKPHLVDGPVKNASAFVTSLARFRLLDETKREIEVSFLYRALVAIEEDTEWLGPTGQLLIGQAMLSLGLGDKMFEHFQTALNREGLPAEIAHEMRFAMAEHLLREKKLHDAELLLLDLSLNGEGVIQAKARLRLAECALNDNRPEDCLATCHDLFASASLDKQALLKLAGRAYEQLGQNMLAAECYRGRMPTP